MYISDSKADCILRKVPHARKPIDLIYRPSLLLSNPLKTVFTFSLVIVLGINTANARPSQSGQSYQI